jgi:hypothetical protein
MGLCSLAANTVNAARQKETWKVAGMTLPEWLEENGKTREWLAGQLGVSQTGASRIVAGKDTKFANLRRIHEITEGAVSPNWMILGRAA